MNMTLAQSIGDVGKGGLGKLLRYFNLLHQIRKEVKRIKPSLVYITPNSAGVPFYKDFVIVQLVKSLGCRVMVHFHNKGVVTRQDKLVDNFLYKRFFRNTKIILLAKSLYRDIEKYVDERDVYFCSNGIPESLTHHRITDARRLNILFLSNMMRAKGVLTLLLACAKLKSRRLPFHCIFAGAWKDISEADFAIKVNELHLDEDVEAVGPQYGEDKEKYLNLADVFVLPSYNECLPLTIIESMQHGVACISTNVGAIPSVIDEGETGFVIAPGDSDALADKLQWLIEHPEACKAMGKCGYEKYRRNYTLEQFENNFSKILREETSCYTG
uniref:Glycosyltransferase family 4 protein n=2 Tax=unclassified Prevotella TaxID=2638335 RepID=A0AB33IRM7_9BACT